METILRDRSLHEFYVQDTLERQSAHGCLRALAKTIEALFGRPISAATLPGDVVLRPLRFGERRVQLSNGSIAVVDNESQAFFKPLPDDFDCKRHLQISHTIDRGSVGLSLMHFCLDQQYLFTLFFGVYHDMWNSIKNAATSKATAGRLWKSIWKFTRLCNMNHGPFQSGAWGTAKQEALHRWVDSNTIDSPSFRRVAPLLAASYSMACDTTEDLTALFRKMATLPSCTESGPVLKCSRWLSIQECWTYYKPEMWGLKEVLLLLANENEHDRSFQEDDSTPVAGGIIKQAPHLITQDLIDDMDLFCMATAVQHKLYSHRTSQIKNPGGRLAVQHRPLQRTVGR